MSTTTVIEDEKGDLRGLETTLNGHEDGKKAQPDTRRYYSTTSIRLTISTTVHNNKGETTITTT
jgi:hypothetical protein